MERYVVYYFNRNGYAVTVANGLTETEARSYASTYGYEYASEDRYYNEIR